jgi:phosphoribosylanthranilate isomerase
MTDEELRELAAASEAAIQMVMVIEGCTRETAVEILRQAEVAAYQVAFGPDKGDTIH